MNKLLLGTTAIVGASLVMAGGALAAKPKLKVSGGIEIQIGGSTQDLEAFGDNVGLGSAGAHRGYVLLTDAEIHFNASGKTDAGMKWKAQVQLEGDPHVGGSDSPKITESSIDETWIRFSGSWGQVNLGNDDGAEDLMHVSSEGPVNKAGTGGTDGDYTDYIEFTAVNSRFKDNSTLAQDSSDATKISYFTPRISGLQVGVSFTPDRGAAGQSTSTDSSSDFENTWGFGVQYKKKFGGVKVAAAGVLHIADTEEGSAGTGNEDKEDLTAWMVGASVGYGNWKFGAGYQDNGDGGQDKGVVNDDHTAWDIGLGYSSGPVHLGVSYMHNEVGAGAGFGDDESDVFFLGATYVLGGGAKVFAEVFWLDQEPADTTRTFNEGYGIIIGTAVKF